MLKEKALEMGPLESMFPVASSKILDFLSTFKEWDYSVSDIAKYSGISFKTALVEIKKLEKQGVVVQTRTVGKATMYKLNLKSRQGYHIDKLIFEIASRRIKEEIDKQENLKGKNVVLKIKSRRKNILK